MERRQPVDASLPKWRATAAQEQRCSCIQIGVTLIADWPNALKAGGT
jgi:hypothetical protein